MNGWGMRSAVVHMCVWLREMKAKLREMKAKCMVEGDEGKDEGKDARSL